MDENKLIALAEALDNNDNPKLKAEAEKAYNNIKDIAKGSDKRAAQVAQKAIQTIEYYRSKRKTKAAHGAKLNYIKSLKHICPEGEELVYYKEGGSVKCGCKGKKMEEGAKVEKAATGVVAKFKAVKKGKTGYKNDDKQDSAKKARSIVTFTSTVAGQQAGFNRAAKEKDKQQNNQNHQKSEIKEGWDNHGNYIVRKSEIKKRENQLKANKTEEETTPPKINKGLHRNLKGGTVEKFKAKCGSKMKKHQQGGSFEYFLSLKNK